MAQAQSSAVADVKQLGLVAGIASLGYVFWVVGAMEMVERLAYYGVKAVATLYAKAPASEGGLGVSLSDFGNLLLAWAMFQTVVPVFTGGLSDRFGYKQTIAASTVVKIGGYLLMAAFPTYWGFFAGAIVLATGTAIFKPGIQGTLVKATSRENSSLAWGVFYQTVNIGGFLGPLVAGFMRKMEWRYVFLACAAIICLNFLLLLTYKEPGLEETRAQAKAKADALAKAKADAEAWVKARAEAIAAGQEVDESEAPPAIPEEPNLFRDSLRELRRPHVWPYLLIFSGFWFMFNSLFDVLPAHIEDWVDTRDIVSTLFGGSGQGVNPVVAFFVVMNDSATEIQPEGMLNVNAGLIMITCFVFAWLSGKLQAIHSMVLGTLFASVALLASGLSTLGWVSLGAIAIFSVGEMMSSPKFSEYVGNFAPSDKKAMYLGFAQIPIAIGWMAESKLCPMLYDRFSSKETFSREMLMEKGWSADQVAAVPQGEAFDELVKLVGGSSHDVTAMLLQHHDPGAIWIAMAAIGVVSAVGIAGYGAWVKRLNLT
ncbi:MAG: MFS transporter [Alphaproteobacteria bacterium]|nr:MFS transporter [Alphaproteobacteria bacterium]MCB9698096.1 MFS transporter [Alphaproteobacteria bacterium]